MGREAVSSAKSYLGDAVYADVDEFGRIVLTTENGIYATNTIVLEPEVYAALLVWVDRLRSAATGSSAR
jgi:hypothetical protein